MSTIAPVDMLTLEEREEAEAARAEFEALPETKKTGKVPELGVTFLVPEGVEVEPRQRDAHCAAAMLPSGQASRFRVIVGDGVEDRADFAERLARHRSALRDAIDVIRPRQEIGEALERGCPTSLTDGSSAGSEWDPSIGRA